jgi:hypothetical protein
VSSQAARSVHAGGTLVLPAIGQICNELLAHPGLPATKEHLLCGDGPLASSMPLRQ